MLNNILLITALISGLIWLGIVYMSKKSDLTKTLLAIGEQAQTVFALSTLVVLFRMLDMNAAFAITGGLSATVAYLASTRDMFNRTWLENAQLLLIVSIAGLVMLNLPIDVALLIVSIGSGSLFIYEVWQSGKIENKEESIDEELSSWSESLKLAFTLTIIVLLIRNVLFLKTSAVDIVFAVAAIVTAGLWLKLNKKLKQDAVEDVSAMFAIAFEFIKFTFVISLASLLIRNVLFGGDIQLDFALILVSLIGVSGLLYLLDKFYITKKLKAKGENISKDVINMDKPAIIKLSNFLLPVFIVVFAVRSFVAEPFKIPSGSMYPTLEVNDFILVNRFAYGVRWPLGNIKLIEVGSPQVGDVIVFVSPKEPEKDYIKRVVGVPGNRIRYENNELYVNNVKISATPLGEYMTLTDDYGRKTQYQVYTEQLGSVSHKLLKFAVLNNSNFKYPYGKGNTGSLITPYIEDTVIPEGYYLVLGDNRDGSADSRFWGLVPDSALKGKAFLIWWHGSKETGTKSSRIGTIIE